MRSIAPLLQRLLRLLFIGTPRGSASRIRCVDRPNTPCRVRVLSFDQRGVKSLAFRLGKFFVAQMADHPMPARGPCAAAGSTAITSPVTPFASFSRQQSILLRCHAVESFMKDCMILN